jgi:hypothetical protein
MPNSASSSHKVGGSSLVNEADFKAKTKKRGPAGAPANTTAIKIGVAVLCLGVGGFFIVKAVSAPDVAGSAFPVDRAAAPAPTPAPTTDRPAAQRPVFQDPNGGGFARP